MSGKINLHIKSFLNAYSQVFFSDNRIFAFIVILVTFVDFYTGLAGLTAVAATSIAANLIGYDKNTISRGIYGFNSLLVGLGLGIYYEPSLFLFLIIAISALLTLLFSVIMQGVIGKYALPFLSVPFLLGIWTVSLASRDFEALGISERGIYTLNELYILGGDAFIRLYDWWNGINFPVSLRTYFLSLGAILFQYNMLAGILLCAGLLFFSRIAFTLSFIGFYTAYLFYEVIGADLTEINYTYIGFNYVLTSIAAGGFFIIPSRRSYFWVVLLIPMVALLTISLSSVFFLFKLPIYSLPFNIMVLMYLYALKFRTSASPSLQEVLIQQNSPEKNLYSFHNDKIRFRHGHKLPVKLPFYGKWNVSQALDGEHTHKGAWQYAWDFNIRDSSNREYKGSGDIPENYHCYGKSVIAPADGYVESVDDEIPDNKIGDVNILQNWGNTIVIKHADHLYSSLSHLKPGTLRVKPGDRVKQGEVIASCGNSGRSPYPHLHMQFQSTPQIGSATLKYPISYYIEHPEKGGFEFRNFDFPLKDQAVSNIETSQLIKHAFHLVPGKRLTFNVTRDGRKYKAEWEVDADPYNNTYLLCRKTGSMAYFENDGYLLYFNHFKGNRKSLLYYFFLASFKVQTGFYQDLIIRDQYPVNLLFSHPVRYVQDFVAPFHIFLKADYEIRYAFSDNDFSPEKILLESSAINKLGGEILRKIDFAIHIGRQGIQVFTVRSGKLTIKSECTD